MAIYIGNTVVKEVYIGGTQIDLGNVHIGGDGVHLYDFTVNFTDNINNGSIDTTSVTYRGYVGETFDGNRLASATNGFVLPSISESETGDDENALVVGKNGLNVTWTVTIPQGGGEATIVVGGTATSTSASTSASTSVSTSTASTSTASTSTSTASTSFSTSVPSTSISTSFSTSTASTSFSTSFPSTSISTVSTSTSTASTSESTSTISTSVSTISTSVSTISTSVSTASTSSAVQCNRRTLTATAFSGGVFNVSYGICGSGSSNVFVPSGSSVTVCSAKASVVTGGFITVGPDCQP